LALAGRRQEPEPGTKIPGSVSDPGFQFVSVCDAAPSRLRWTHLAWVETFAWTSARDRDRLHLVCDHRAPPFQCVDAGGVAQSPQAIAGAVTEKHHFMEQFESQ
jgi:hypothetical protein